MNDYEATQIEYYDEMAERNEDACNAYDATQDY